MNRSRRWVQQRATGAMEHSQSVWRRSLIAANGSDLARIGFLAEHVSTCSTCSRTWIEGDRPVDHLETLVRRSSMRDIWQAAS
jgi:hypothetical protein